MNTFIASAGVLFLAVGLRADALWDGFRNPPETAKLQAWWHWSGDNVTKTGIAADLKAMGEKGIGVAHVFAPAMMGSIPGVGKRLLSPEWRECFAFAVAEAKRNGVKLGFHNCPGWSSSGGPWIRPEDSMKVVVASETDVTPPAASVRLPRPQTNCGFYRDIAVLAFPVKKTVRPAQATADFPADGAAFLAGAKPLVLPLGTAGATCSVTFRYPEPVSPTAAVLRLDETQFYAKGSIDVSSDGSSWTHVKDFTYTLFNAAKTPKVLRLDRPARNARLFRVSFAAIPTPPWVGVRDRRLVSMAFTDLPVIADIDDRNSSATAFGYVPPPAGEENRPGLAKDAFVDLSSRLSPDGTLDLSPSSPDSPASRLLASSTPIRILRIGYTSTGKGPAPATLQGLECDKLSKKGLDAHWPHMPRVLLDTPGARGTVTVSLIDSYEVGGQNWTEGFPAEFRRRRGYDLAPYLPAIVGYAVGTAGETAKFLYDWQRTVADLFAENYFDYFAELCHREGIDAATEPYGGPFATSRCGARSDVPTGEFWIGRGKTGSPRAVSSCAHLNGHVRVAAEAFTTEAKEGRWQITPHQLRVEGDLGWLEGVSQLVYHSYLHQPFANVAPGLSLGRHGTQLNRHTTWWPELGVWSRYVWRGQYLLQRGRPRAEVLLFVGESTPNAYVYPADLTRAGANFDWCGVEDLARLAVAGKGVAVPGGAPYDVLCLGRDRHLSVATLRTLQRLLAGGARIAGRCPLSSPTLADVPEVWQSLVRDLWFPADAAAPRIREQPEPRAALTAFGLRPNLESAGGLRALRREMDGRDVYFVVNDSDEAFAGGVSFAAAGAPSLWNAADGSRRALGAVVTNDPGRVRTVLALPPHGSGFVVFDPSEKPAAIAEPRVETAEVSILSAAYRARDDRTMTRDVTLALRAKYAGGQRIFPVTNAELGGDPASNHRKVLELVCTVDGERRSLTVQERSSVSLVFPRRPQAPAEAVLVDLSTGWTAVFTGRNAPTGTVSFAKLASWNLSSDPRLAYFAGRARYEKTVETPVVTGPVVLDLGDVRELANVSVNGRFLATLWEAPYRVVLPAELFAAGAPKTFRLAVEVVNTWPNRLIGDAKARAAGAAEPQEKGYPKWVLEDRPDSGTGIFTWSNWLAGWTAQDRTLPAGLLGPVRLVAPGE